MPLALSSAPTAPARPRRWGAALGLVLGVAWLHGLLFGVLAPGLPQRTGPGAVHPAPGLLVRTLPARPRAADVGGPPGAGAAPAVAGHDVPTVAPRAVLPTPPVPAGRADPPPPPPGAGTATAPGRAPDRAPEGADRAAVGAGDPGDPGDEAAATGPAAAEPSSAAAAVPPPVYATRVPAPVRLRYALQYNGQVGEATLDWRQDGRQYTLTLDGRGATQPLVVQASRGGFDAAGLAPERFTDRRRGRSMQAANFRRDIGRIGFSGPALDHPAWPGAQDRLSWLPQFVAIRAAALAARADAPPTPISLFVVDARGAGALWHFEPDGEAVLDTPMGPVPAQRWRREPPRPEGLRVEAWLDGARGHWPVLLRFTALRSGDLFELRLLDEPAPPPGP